MIMNIYKFSDSNSRFFLRFNQEHNFGKSYELICWFSNDMINSEYLCLLYKFELCNVEVVGMIETKEVIKKLKSAIVSLNLSKSSTFYHKFISISANKFLCRLLDDYSINAFYHQSAMKIQKMWLIKYYNPKEMICKKRLQRECEKMNEQITMKRLCFVDQIQ